MTGATEILAPVAGATDIAASSRSAREASLGSAVRLATELVIRTSSIAATLWLTRSLGVETFGSFLIALSIGLLIGDVCDLGLNAIVVPQVVRGSTNLRTLLALKAKLTLMVALLSLGSSPSPPRCPA